MNELNQMMSELIQMFHQRWTNLFNLFDERTSSNDSWTICSINEHISIIIHEWTDEQIDSNYPKTINELIQMLHKRWTNHKIIQMKSSLIVHYETLNCMKTRCQIRNEQRTNWTGSETNFERISKMKDLA